MTITQANLQAAFQRYVKACHRLGLVPEGETIGLAYGSKKYGQTFKVYTGTAETGQSAPPAGSMNIGMTKAEAFDLLADRASVLEDVARAKGW